MSSIPATNDMSSPLYLLPTKIRTLEAVLSSDLPEWHDATIKDMIANLPDRIANPHHCTLFYTGDGSDSWAIAVDRLAWVSQILDNALQIQYHLDFFAGDVKRFKHPRTREEKGHRNSLAQLELAISEGLRQLHSFVFDIPDPKTHDVLRFEDQVLGKRIRNTVGHCLNVVQLRYEDNMEEQFDPLKLWAWCERALPQFEGDLKRLQAFSVERALRWCDWEAAHWGEIEEKLKAKAEAEREIEMSRACECAGCVASANGGFAACVVGQTQDVEPESGDDGEWYSTSSSSSSTTSATETEDSETGLESDEELTDDPNTPSEYGNESISLSAFYSSSIRSTSSSSINSDLLNGSLRRAISAAGAFEPYDSEQDGYLTRSSTTRSISTIGTGSIVESRLLNNSLRQAIYLAGVAEPIVESELLTNSLMQAIYQTGVAESSNVQQDHHSTDSSTSSSNSTSRTQSMVESIVLRRTSFWAGFFEPPASKKQGGKFTLLTTFSSDLKLWSNGMVDLAEGEEDEGYSSASDDDEDRDEEDLVLFMGRRE